MNPVVKVAGVLGVGTVGLVGLLTCTRTVGVGEVGFESLFGDVKHVARKPGIHFVNPFVNMIKVEVMTRNMQNDIEVASSEGLGIEVRVNTLFNISSDKARYVYTTFGPEYKESLIRANIQSVVRDVASSYEAKALYTDKAREDIKGRIHKEISSKLEKHGVVVSDLLINRIILPQQLSRAIEQKLQAEQEKEKMDFTIERSRKEMHFKIEQEENEAKRKAIEAKGIQEFQKIVTEGISDKLLTWKGIEATSQLANSPGSKTILIGQKNGLPLIFNADNK